MRLDKKTDDALIYALGIRKAFLQRNDTERILWTKCFLEDSPGDWYSNIADVYCRTNHDNGTPLCDIYHSEEERKEAFILFYAETNDYLYNHFKVEHVSADFYNAVKANISKLLDSYEGELYYSLFGECAGVFLTPSHMIQYAIREKGTMLILHTRRSREAPHSEFFYPHNLRFSFPKKPKEDELENLPFYFIGILMMKRFGEVESVMAESGARKMIYKQECLNTLPCSISFLDSSWLRTIVRTEGFMVRGHFRLQPYGEGMRQRKLIYIKPFEKHGYTRRAKKLIAEERGE